MNQYINSIKIDTRTILSNAENDAHRLILSEKDSRIVDDVLDDESNIYLDEKNDPIMNLFGCNLIIKLNDDTYVELIRPITYAAINNILAIEVHSDGINYTLTDIKNIVKYSTGTNFYAFIDVSKEFGLLGGNDNKYVNIRSVRVEKKVGRNKELISILHFRYNNRNSLVGWSMSFFLHSGLNIIDLNNNDKCSIPYVNCTILILIDNRRVIKIIGGSKSYFNMLFVEDRILSFTVFDRCVEDGVIDIELSKEKCIDRGNNLFEYDLRRHFLKYKK